MESNRFGFEGTQAKITLSLACNNDCRFCYNRLDKTGAKVLEESRVRALVDEAHQEGRSQLNLIGGEVTILPYFLDVLAYGGTRFRSISVNTNGRRFSDMDFARRAVEAGLTEVDVSLHGARPEIHDAVSRAPGAFAETVQGLRNLSCLHRETGRPLVSVTTVVLDWNVDALEDIGSLLREIGIPSWRVKYAYGALSSKPDQDESSYVVPYARAIPRLRAVVDAHAGPLNIALHDLPPCVSGPLVAFSTAFERHRVARYDEQGLAEVVSVLERWGDTSQRCATCAAREVCPKPSRAYLARYGDEEFVPLDDAAWDALRREAEELAATVSSRGHQRGESSPQPVPASHDAPEVQAGFRRIDEAAKSGAWETVRQEATAILTRTPDNPAALRMRRFAEMHLLDEVASRLERAGDKVRARRTRALLEQHYGDLLRAT